MKLSETIQQEINQKFQTIKSVEDLVILMTFVYGHLYPNIQTKIEINKRKLHFIAFSKKERYKSFTIPKKSGGERKIFAPIYTLKVYQKILNEILQIVFTPHKSSHGFLPGKSIVSNANLHYGKQHVYNIDLKDFFPSTSFRRVKTVLQLSPFNLNQDRESLGFLIANLCCNDNGLPQGAPTSPILTNIVCQRLDRKLLRFAAQYKSSYTRYADDITYSSNQNKFSAEFESKLQEIIHEEGFEINSNKTRLQDFKRRQEVTGLIVNRKVNLNIEFIKQVRFWLYVWEKFGYASFHERLSSDYIKSGNTSKRKGGHPLNVLRGKINFISMVRGKEDSTVIQFKRKFDELNKKQKANEHAKHALVDIERIIDIWEAHGINAALLSIRKQ
ncbi:MAG: RNA-directed DNA polymerase [Bacteroidetes bacterium]|nr:RNA-directed DNA polymerase [Bacteroidota bacterium]MBK9411924.1 RNA-directed DNA polymerase [Bacteroidota bacterium]